MIPELVAELLMMEADRDTWRERARIAEARVAELEAELGLVRVERDLCRDAALTLKAQLAACRAEAAAMREALDGMVRWCRPLCERAHDLGAHGRECPVDRAQAALSSDADKGWHGPEERARIAEARVAELEAVALVAEQERCLRLEGELAGMRSVLEDAADALGAAQSFLEAAYDAADEKGRRIIGRLISVKRSCDFYLARRGGG